MPNSKEEVAPSSETVTDGKQILLCFTWLVSLPCIRLLLVLCPSKKIQVKKTTFCYSLSLFMLIVHGGWKRSKFKITSIFRSTLNQVCKSTRVLVWWHMVSCPMYWLCKCKFNFNSTRASFFIFWPFKSIGLDPLNQSLRFSRLAGRPDQTSLQ